MPWKMEDAPANTRKADTWEKKKRWSATANAVLAKSGDEGKALRIANAVVKKQKQHKKKAKGLRAK